MKPFQRSVLCVLVAFTSLTISVIGQPGVQKCRETYFPQAHTIKFDENGGYKFVRCTEPSPELCDVLVGIRADNQAGIGCLLDAGFDFNVESRKFYSNDIPIMVAAYRNLDILKLILKSKIPVDIEVRTKSGDTPLTDLTSFRYYRIVNYGRGFSIERINRSIELLLENGADPNVVVDGETALMRANGRTEAVRLLLKYNANIYATDKNGDSAIFHAIDSCDSNKITQLLEKDGNILKSVNFSGISAFQRLKKQSKSKECSELKTISKSLEPGAH
jgi:ankyrin repeat protein